VAGHIRAPLGFGEQPGRQHDEGGFGKFAGLEGIAADVEPTPGPVDFLTRQQDEEHEGEARAQDQQGEAAKLCRRQQRDGE
jgi:hypothetical protein